MDRNQKERYLQLLRVQMENKQLFYNPSDPQKRFHESQARFKFMRAGSQSGKSFCTTHELAWWLMEKHPYRKLPEPLYKIAWVIGPSKGDVASVIWDLYLKRFIPPKFVKKEGRVGGVLDRVEFSTGWTLFFKSYEAGRESIQMAPVDFILVDEMLPDDILDELEARVSVTRGSIAYSFTPLKISRKIKRYFENPGSQIETFLMSRYDNPLVDKEKLKEEESRMDKRTAAVRIWGAWVDYEGHLFPSFSLENVVEEFKIPDSWRRICSIDPATSSDSGVIWAAQNPGSGSWVVYQELLIRKLAPSDLIHRILEESHGDKIYNYFVDQQAAYLVAEAHKYGIALMGVKKANEKENMVNELNQAFKDKNVYIMASCKQTVQQINEYTNKPNEEEFKPVREDDHLVDALCYFYRGKPIFSAPEKDRSLGDTIMDSMFKKVSSTDEMGFV